MTELDTDKNRGWLQLAKRSDEVTRHNSVSLPVPSRQPSAVPATSGTSRPLTSEIKHSATAGPLASEMKYPDIHAIPTRASYRRTRHGSLGVVPRTMALPRPVDQDSNREPAAAANFAAGGSLRRKSNDTGRHREMTFGTRHAGLPPSDYSQKHYVSPADDWTAASEIEYRV